MLGCSTKLRIDGMGHAESNVWVRSPKFVELLLIRRESHLKSPWSIPFHLARLALFRNIGHCITSARAVWTCEVSLPIFRTVALVGQFRTVKGFLQGNEGHEPLFVCRAL